LPHWLSFIILYRRVGKYLSTRRTKMKENKYFTHSKERFLNFDDASMWLERNLSEIRANDWELLEARLVYIDGVWHTGVSFGAS